MSRIGMLEYALAKQVPDMERGFTIETSYGSIGIEGEDAKHIVNAVRKVIEKSLAYAILIEKTEAV